MGAMVAPLAGWNVRGYSYGERQEDGQLHPGADLNVGYGDQDLGLPVVALADGVVVARREWDGFRYGYGNVGLVEHHLVRVGQPDTGGEVRLWSLYAHLDEFDESFREGAPVVAGQRLGACGKSGRQWWAHLHLELRYQGPPEMPLEFWGGRLAAAELSERYADPFTVLRTLAHGGQSDPQGGEQAERLVARVAALRGELEVVRADRDYNYGLKMAFEGCLRELEGRRRVKRGTVARLIEMR